METSKQPNKATIEFTITYVTFESKSILLSNMAFQSQLSNTCHSIPLRLLLTSMRAKWPSVLEAGQSLLVHFVFPPSSIFGVYSFELIRELVQVNKCLVL